MSVGSKKGPSSNLNVRIDSNVKLGLETKAAQAGMSLSDYLRQHYMELVSQGQITPVDEVGIPNPYQYYVPPTPYTPAINYPTYPAPMQYPYSQPYIVQPDAVDQMVNEMRKLVVVKMMKELLQERATPEQFLAASQGKAMKDDFSMADMMKWQMIQNQMDKQYAQQMTQANAQLEAARAKGDKAGENTALQLIAAMSQNQMAQSQNFMQQFMAAMQLQQNTQQTLFNTALTGQRQGEAEARQERNEFDQKIENVRNQLVTSQMQTITETNKLQIGWLNGELERIRNEPKKDIIAQLDELITLRDKSPVYKAVFDATFGVKPGGIGDLVPRLKELGADKVIDKVLDMLKALVIKPPALPAPAPLIMPPGATGEIPPPLPIQGQPLETLKLPPANPQATVPLTPPAKTEIVTIPTESESEQSVGYTNLDKIKEEEQSASPPPPPPPEQTQQETPLPPPQEEQEPYQGKSFTTGRKRKQTE